MHLCISVCLCISLSVYNCVCMCVCGASVHKFVFQYVSIFVCLDVFRCQSVLVYLFIVI